ncbi:Hydrogenase maturation factor HypC [Methanimicrococcus sp. At1]|uniref:Hydrogenase maturation factor HypC n=1 Tax=Methanimicrococcus hacksteinii TaxID=3028293 RepID=A0ABU3VMQ2_9EURY|nr:HypC/HybG/HupF family hydrogenase formation chaperone [Methanimicrococcus sp. At1]MDV0444688.1 Hydrogenase maturation factor HypC [Methanimicrococcus sp. At1]
MCIAIPGKISKIISENQAEVDFGGVFRDVNLDLLGGSSEINVGDHVLVHVGYAISVITEEEARLTREAFDELLEANEEFDRSVGA